MSKKSDILRRLNEWVLLTGKRKGELAELLSMSPQQFSRLINGFDNLGPSVQERMEALGVDVDWILTGRKNALTESEINTKGDIIARYFIPKTRTVSSVIVETEKADDGFYISVYNSTPRVMVLPPQTDAAAARSTADVLDMDTDARPPSYIHKAAATPVFHKKK